MHKRTEIRNWIVEYISNNTSFFSKIYSGRAKTNHDDSFPFLTIFTRDEDIEEYHTSHTKRVLDLRVGIVVKENAEDDLDTITENALYELEKVMSKIVYVKSTNPDDPFYLFDEIVHTGTSIKDDTDGNSNLGMAMLKYSITYSYQRPIDLIFENLPSFDEMGSIQGMNILNEGVPID